jgi:hypothetical protein
MRERLRVIAPYAIVLVLAGALSLVATHFEYTRTRAGSAPRSGRARSWSCSPAFASFAS